MMDIDFEKLEKLAKAATPGPWISDGNVCPDDISIWAAPLEEEKFLGNIGVDSIRQVGICKDFELENSEFIAAANPSTLLALIERLRAADAERDAKALVLGNIGVWSPIGPLTSEQGQQLCRIIDYAKEAAEPQYSQFKNSLIGAIKAELEQLRPYADPLNTAKMWLGDNPRDILVHVLSQQLAELRAQVEAAKAQEPVGEVAFADFQGMDAIAGEKPFRMAVNETSRGSIQALPRGTKLYALPPIVDEREGGSEAELRSMLKRWIPFGKLNGDIARLIIAETEELLQSYPEPKQNNTVTYRKDTTFNGVSVGRIDDGLELLFCADLENDEYQAEIRLSNEGIKGLLEALKFFGYPESEPKQQAAVPEGWKLVHSTETEMIFCAPHQDSHHE